MTWDPAHLREARERRGVTQAELARRLGMTQPAVAKWEGGREPLASTLGRIAEALGCTTDELVGRT